MTSVCRLLCLSSGSASSEGLGLCGLRRRVLQRPCSPRQLFWSISWLRHQMFYPYVTISAAQARKSDNLHHVMSPFSLFLSSFSGMQRILGYVRRIVAVHPQKQGKEGATGGAFRLGQPSRRVVTYADPELRHSSCPAYIQCSLGFSVCLGQIVNISVHSSIRR